MMIEGLSRNNWRWATRGGAVFADNPPNGEKIPPLRAPGIIVVRQTSWSGNHRGLVVGVFDCGPTGRRFECATCQSTLTSLPSGPWLVNQRPWYVQQCLCDWAYIKYPVPLIEKSRPSCPGGRFPSSFILQVIIITRLNKLYDLYSLRCHQGVKHPLLHQVCLCLFLD